MSSTARSCDFLYLNFSPIRWNSEEVLSHLSSPIDEAVSVYADVCGDVFSC